MTDDLLENVRVYRDNLWRSMVIDIRAHLIQAEAAGVLSEPFLGEPLTNEMTLTCEGGFISIWLQPDTGKGSWNQISPIDECEPWFMSVDGAVELNGNCMRVSEAAKWFMDRLTAK